MSIFRPLSSKIRLQKVQSLSSIRCYHSYPDPNEKPQITQTISNAKRQLNKKDFELHRTFSLKEAFPGAPLSKGIDTSTAPKTLQTTLPNGFTVASQELPGLMSSFAFIVRAGSSYENQAGKDAAVGVTQFLELNAFKSTKNKNQLELVTEIEKMGGLIQCVTTRENIIYCIDVLRENTVPAFQLFADSIFHPTYPDDELDEARMIIQLQQEELPSEIFSRDLVQQAGYINKPLGNHHFCPIDLVNNITSKHLYQFRNQYYIPSNCVLSGVGVDHNELIELSEKYFQFPVAQNNNNSSHNSIIRPTSQYTGGLLLNHRELKEPFIKIAMAFDCGGWKDDSLIAVCVLQQLLGGGSSFSAGGPGKGMYSRLYTQVLNRYHWAESVEAFVSIHEDHGLLGIDGACPPANIPHMIRTIVQQFSELAVRPISKIELNRAKNMLKSMMMMQLESRLVICEDIARQIITFGTREDPIDVCSKIDAITEKDLMNVAIRMLQSPPSIGVVGPDLSHVPSYDDIKLYTQHYYQEYKKNSNHL